jgi:hypothetical protein
LFIGNFLLKTRKRGKRAGIKLHHRAGNNKVPLPAILLTNVRSLLPKIDELAALLKGKHMQQLTQVLCITETWLTDNINDQQTDLDGFDQHRNDRKKGSKSRGGGISIYINKSWSKSNKIIHSLNQSDIEILSVISRPMWLPREFSSVITVACYAPCTGSDGTKSATANTARLITQNINDIQLKYPNSVILIMGDFNKVKISIPDFKQIQ